MPQIVLKNIQFTNVKDKRTGTGISTILTLTNVGNSSLGKYVNSANFYKLISALDIEWGDISVGNGVIISDTADLINWISSLPASGGNGKSAYELYVESEEGKGNTPLSLSEWLESLLGQQGIAGVSPHIDPSTGNWFIGETNTGVHAQGIDGSQGLQGLQGKSNYELYLETVPQGETPLTQLEWLDSLKGLNGTNGINGTNGTDGKSAYEIYVDHVPNGSTALTEEAWLTSLKGKDGKDGQRGYEGKSAYEIYFENTEDPLDVDEWLESLKGADGTMSFQDLTEELRASLVGETGPAGPSAYQSYRNTTADDPILTEEEWVASLHGQTGAAGTTPHIDASTKHWFIGNTDTNILAEGVNGQDGQPGADGSNGITPHIDPITGNWFIGETDTEVHAQGVPGIDGSNGITPHIDPTTGNWFIGETDTEIHAQGEIGQSGADGITPHIDASTGNWFIGETNTGIPAQGPTGQNGVDGSTGKSAYELYVDGIQEGEPLSQEDWLASLKGEEGDSAYEVAVTNGFVGTEQQWLDSLLPTINVDPSSNNASDIYWFIKGEKTQYRAIPQIISITSAAYDALQEKDETAIYVITDSQYNQDNEVAYRIGNITPTTDINNLDVSVRRSNNVVYFDFTLPIANLDVSNLTEAQATLLRGKSNYQIYVDNHDVDLDGPLLTEEQWLATLKGEVGNDGKSAYELYAENYISTHGDDTGMLTESEWLNSLIPQIVKDSSDNLYWHINNQKTQYRAFPEIQFLTLDEYNALETKEDDVIYIIDNDKEATALTFNIGNVTTSALETDASVNIRRIDNSIYFDFVLPFSIDSSEYKGESAYEIYRRNASTGEILSETAWIDSLKGKSAYELFAAANPSSVYTNESQWLASLKGETGKDGSQGPQGPMPTITINQEGYWVVNDQVMQSALGRLPEIRNGLYVDPETGDELSMKTWWIDGADTNVPTSLGVDVTTLLNKIGAIGNAQEFEPSTYYTAEDEEVIGGTKEVGEVKTPAVAAVPHTVKSYVDNAVANVHVNIDASNIYTKSEVDQKFEDLIGQAPETLDTLKEIADKLSDEDTSLGQLNAVLLNKADASTTYTKSEVDALILPTDWDNNDPESSLFIKNKPFGTFKVTKIVPYDTNSFHLNNKLSKNAAGHLYLSSYTYSVSSTPSSNLLQAFRTPNNMFILYVKGKYIGIYKIIRDEFYYYTQNYDITNNRISDNSNYEWAFFSDSAGANTLSISWMDINDLYTSIDDEEMKYYDFEFYFIDENGDITINAPIANRYININNIINDKAIEDKPFGEIQKNNIISETILYNDASMAFTQTGPSHYGQGNLIFSEVLLPGDIISLEIDGNDYGSSEVVDVIDNSTTWRVVGVGNFAQQLPFKMNWSIFASNDKYTLAINNIGTGTHSVKISKVLYNKVDATKKLDSKYVDYNSYIENKNILDSEKPFGEYYYYSEEELFIETNGTTYALDAPYLSFYNFYPWSGSSEQYPTPLQEADKVNIYIDDVLRFTCIIPANFNGAGFDNGVRLASNSASDISSIHISYNKSDWKYEASTEYKVTLKIQRRLTGIKTLDAKYIPSSLLSNYVTIADVSANEYVIASALVELNTNKADKDTTYTKTEIDSIIENLDNGVDPNDLSIYELKSDLANDLSIYALKSDLTNDLSIYELKSDLSNDLSIYELKSDLANDLSIYVLNSSLIEIEEVISGAISSLNTNKVDVSALNDYVQKTALENTEKVIAAALVQLNESVTSIDASIIDIKQNGAGGGTINPNDLSIYELKSDLVNDLSIYTSKAYVDQKFDDLINNAPATLDTLKEIADKLSDEDTSLGQLNAILTVKADASTTYTKSEVDTLYNNINSSLNNYVLNSSLIDVEEVIAESITQLNDTLDELSGNIYTKDEIDDLIVTSNDLSIYELKSELANDLSIYELKSDLINDLSIYELKSDLANDLSIYVLKTDLEDTEKVIATTLIQINDSITTIDASIIDIKQNGGGNSGINSSVLDNYVLKTYIGTLPNKTENIYYTQEEITNASVGDDAYGKTTTDIKTPATQYIDLIEAIEENEEVTAAAIVDMNSKVTDISTRLDNIVAGPTIWVGTQSQYNSLESIDQTTIYIIKADEV